MYISIAQNYKWGALSRARRDEKLARVKSGLSSMSGIQDHRDLGRARLILSAKSSFYWQVELMRLGHWWPCSDDGPVDGVYPDDPMTIRIFPEYAPDKDPSIFDMPETKMLEMRVQRLAKWGVCGEEHVPQRRGAKARISGPAVVTERGVELPVTLDEPILVRLLRGSYTSSASSEQRARHEELAFVSTSVVFDAMTWTRWLVAVQDRFDPCNKGTHSARSSKLEVRSHPRKCPRENQSVTLVPAYDLETKSDTGLRVHLEDEPVREGPMPGKKQRVPVFVDADLVDQMIERARSSLDPDLDHVVDSVVSTGLDPLSESVLPSSGPALRLVEYAKSEGIPLSEAIDLVLSTGLDALDLIQKLEARSS